MREADCHKKISWLNILVAKMSVLLKPFSNDAVFSSVSLRIKDKQETNTAPTHVWGKNQADVICTEMFITVLSKVNIGEWL